MERSRNQIPHSTTFYVHETVQDFPHHMSTNIWGNNSWFPQNDASMQYWYCFDPFQDRQLVSDANLNGATSNLHNLYQGYNSSCGFYHVGPAAQGSYSDYPFQHSVTSVAQRAEVPSFLIWNGVCQGSLESMGMCHLQYPEFQMYNGLNSHEHDWRVSNYQQQLYQPSSLWHQMSTPLHQYTSHSSLAGNGVHGGSPEMMGPDFQIYNNLNSHVHYWCVNNHLQQLHQPSSHGHRMSNSLHPYMLSSFLGGNGVHGDSLEMTYPEFQTTTSLDSDVLQHTTHPSLDNIDETFNRLQMLLRDDVMVLDADRHWDLSAVPFIDEVIIDELEQRGNGVHGDSLEMAYPEFQTNNSLDSDVPQHTTHSSLDNIDEILNRLQMLLRDDVIVLDIDQHLDLSAVLFNDEVIIDGFEQRGYAGDLSEEEILRHLRTRTYASSNCLELNEKPEICIICQSMYENLNKIGTLQCGHEYHVDCIKRWLQRKNACPLCRAPAVTP